MRFYILILTVLFASAANAASVLEREGNLFYVGDDGNSRKLTVLHADKKPVISPDGQLVVFLRLKEQQKAGDMSASEIWLTDIMGDNTRRLLEAHPHDDPDKNLGHFNTLAFSADSKLLYFLTSAWATSNALHVLELATGKEHFVTDADDVMIVPRGKYAHHLVVMKHKYFEQGGSYDYYWLLTPDGKEIKMVGEDKRQAERFILRQQGKHR